MSKWVSPFQHKKTSPVRRIFYVFISSLSLSLVFLLMAIIFLYLYHISTHIHLFKAIRDEENREWEEVSIIVAEKNKKFIPSSFFTSLFYIQQFFHTLCDYYTIFKCARSSQVGLKVILVLNYKLLFFNIWSSFLYPRVIEINIKREGTTFFYNEKAFPTCMFMLVLYT